jgi:hypothetical protein
MSFDLQRILESKLQFRQRLAARLIVEKLAMLDELRERTLALRGGDAAPAPKSGVIKETSTDYGNSRPTP